MKLYPSGEYSVISGPPYVKTGEFRPPKRGEYYLSGAIPTAYYAPNDLTQAFYIMRRATHEETHCPTCHQRLPLER